MTKVTLYVRGKDDIRGFLCCGHSGYAQEGSDIVCAAVSALTQGCANALETVAGVVPRVRVNDGFLALRLPEDCTERDAQVLLHGMLQGLRDIQARYPGYLRLNVQPVSGTEEFKCFR